MNDVETNGRTASNPREEALNHGSKQWKRRLNFKRFQDQMDMDYILPDMVRMATGRHPNGTFGDGRHWQFKLPPCLLQVLKVFLYYHRVTKDCKWRFPKGFYPDGSWETTWEILCQRAQISRGKLRYALRELEQAGIITRVRYRHQNKNGGWYSTVSFYLHLEKLQELAFNLESWKNKKFVELDFDQKEHADAIELPVEVLEEFDPGMVWAKAEHEHQEKLREYYKSRENTGENPENSKNDGSAMYCAPFPDQGLAPSPFTPPQSSRSAPSSLPPDLMAGCPPSESRSAAYGSEQNLSGGNEARPQDPARGQEAEAREAAATPATPERPGKTEEKPRPIIPAALAEMIRHLLILCYPNVILKPKSLGYLIKWFGACGENRLSTPKLLQWLRFQRKDPKHRHSKVDLDQFCHYWPDIWRSVMSRELAGYGDFDLIHDDDLFPPLEDSVTGGCVCPGVIPKALLDAFFVRGDRPVTLEILCRPDQEDHMVMRRILSRFLLAHFHGLPTGLLKKKFSHHLLKYLEIDVYVFRELLKRQDIPLRDWLPIADADAHMEKIWLKFCDQLAHCKAVADYWNIV